MHVQQLQTTTYQQPISLTFLKESVGVVSVQAGVDAVTQNELKCGSATCLAQPDFQDPVPPVLGLFSPNLSLRRCRCPCLKDLL